METKFYRFNQNNSGGSFVGDYVDIIIEAKSQNEAELIAELNTDIYFDGCEKKMDCSCCGDRWSRYVDVSDVPEIYGQKHNPEGQEYKSWGLQALIIYKNGTKEIFKLKAENE